MTLLSVRNLRVGFGKDTEPTLAVRNISFDIKQGEVLALVGESGSGKSVTALSIMRLIEYGGGHILGGEIMFDTGSGLVDLAGLSTDETTKLRGNALAMIFQEPMTSLNPIFTVGEQIMEPLRLHQNFTNLQARSRAEELLGQVHLPDPVEQMQRYPHELSGGQRQRVMLAMALACRPRLLIADEPTTALDVTIQAQILDLLREVQQETGAALLFITHDMAVVAEVADRVVVMKSGEKLEDAPVEAIFSQPQHPYSKALLAAAPCLGALASTEGPRPFNSAIATPNAPKGKPFLEVRDLVTRFPVRTGLFRRKTAEILAVESASFDIAAGETLALVGESGSGKSTLARSVLRLVEPASGQITLGGTELTGLKTAQMQEIRARMQVVFQDPYASMNPRRQIFDQLADPLRIHGDTGKEELRGLLERLIRQVDLPSDSLERFPHEFSGGQRQRLCIARALSVNPALIVADEPVSALDVSIQAQVVDLLIELQANQGISFLFISHDMAIVERIAHRVAVMRQGRIVEIGPRRAVFNAPQHPYTQQLIEAVPVADPSRRTDRTYRMVSTPINSPVRPLGTLALPIHYTQVSPGHFVERTLASE